VPVRSALVPEPVSTGFSQTGFSQRPAERLKPLCGKAVETAWKRCLAYPRRKRRV
jgi:hypothetical protein